MRGPVPPPTGENRWCLLPYFMYYKADIFFLLSILLHIASRTTHAVTNQANNGKAIFISSSWSSLTTLLLFITRRSSCLLLFNIPAFLYSTYHLLLGMSASLLSFVWPVTLCCL